MEEDVNNGTLIAGFAKEAYRVMFGVKIDPHHHPMTDWAQSTISREQDNFEQTKKETLRLLDGVHHTLHEKQNNEYDRELSAFHERLEEANNIVEFGQEIREAGPLLDKIFSQGKESEPEDRA